jgi:hypothetical protein
MILIVSSDARWFAPLDAMLSMQSASVKRIDDPLDALVEVREGGVASIVFGPGVNEDDAALSSRSIRRRSEMPPWICRVGLESNPAFDALLADPYDYVALVDALVTGRGNTTKADAGPPPLSEVDLLELLKTARHQDYHTLLDVRRDADQHTVAHFAERLLERLDGAEPAALARHDVLGEVREAIEDARDVLLTPSWRAMYESP